MTGRGAAYILLLALALPVVLVTPGAGASDCSKTSVGLTPLTDLGMGTWRGNAGGLYPGGTNVRPAENTALGEALASRVVPRDGAGNPDPANGKIVFLSIGMSNTRNEFAQFVTLANADPMKHPRVVAINGAIGGQPAESTTSPTARYWSDVEGILRQNGATPAQVQAVWLKQANRQPTGDPVDQAKRLQRDLTTIAGILNDKYPNLDLVYASSRTYAGYATTTLNPEPYAYGSGFSVKWLVESQLDGTIAKPPSTGGGSMPWLSWGPYLWADGTAGRSDGFTWVCSDFESDGTHLNNQGSVKVARAILEVVQQDPTARLWYVDGGGVPPPPPPKVADLAVASFTSTSSGTTQRLALTVANGGDADAAPFDVAFSYVHKGERREAGRVTVPGLAAAASVDVTFDWETRLKIGDFTVVAVADAGRAILERSEANNEASTRARVLMGGFEGLDLERP